MNKLNKKAFTLVELLGVIVILGILAGIAVPSFTSYLKKAQMDTYHNYEKSMESSAENYLLMNTGLIPNIGNTVKITADNLIKGKFLEKITDPEGSSTSCNNSYIEVLRKPNTENIGLKYKVCLICKRYKSKDC